MLRFVVLGLGWFLALWYFYDIYNEVRALSSSVINMFHHLRVGICEKRSTIKEIIASEEIFALNGADDFSLFLWENHERLGVSSELIDLYNAFTRESEFSSGQVCEEGIINIENEFKRVLTENQSVVKNRMISFLTMCTAFLAVLIILLV